MVRIDGTQSPELEEFEEMPGYMRFCTVRPRKSPFSIKIDFSEQIDFGQIFPKRLVRPGGPSLPPRRPPRQRFLRKSFISFPFCTRQIVQFFSLLHSPRLQKEVLVTESRTR